MDRSTGVADGQTSERSGRKEGRVGRQGGWMEEMGSVRKGWDGDDRATVVEDEGGEGSGGKYKGES